MTMHFADIVRHAASDGAISAAEIGALRQAGWADGAVSAAEADSIFALNDALAQPTPEWSDFFVEVIGEYVVNGTEPKGYVSDDNAAWLMGRIDKDGACDSLTELELLVRVLERCQNAAEPLKAYALGEIERAVLTGQGPTRRGGELATGRVSEGEVALLRRILFAPGGDGPAAVSANEAEMLFRLKDASLGAANAPEWKRLFVQGVGSFLLGLAAPTAQISRERASELDRFMNNQGVSIGGFIARALTKPDFAGAFESLFGGKERDRLAELAAAKEITDSEQAWLDSQVGADGMVDEYEQALLDFLAEERG